jgi:rod shape-determining protein MreB
VSHSLRVGGNKFDESIGTYIRKKYNLMIGDRTAEEVKIEIGSALPLDVPLSMEVKGRDMIAGLPRTIPITSAEVTEAIEQPIQQIVTAVRNVLERTPPELSSDIIDKGMVMSGGGSLLRNLDTLLTQVTGIPCHVAENALNSVAVGTGLALEHFGTFRKSLVNAS